MDSARGDFARAARLLDGRTVALVYAHSFDSKILNSYYLRQRTETLSGYADVLDLLGAYPVFFNLDQFVELCTRPDQLTKIDYILNIPGGSLNLDLITLASTLATKAGKPIFPATATTISLGQNKPVARCLAREVGWRVPELVPFDKAATYGRNLMLKLKSAGDSYGVRVIDPGAVATLPASEMYMLEEFIRGYDLTTYVVSSVITKRYEVLSSSITIPPDPNNAEWYWDDDSKLRSGGRGAKRFEPLSITREHRNTTSAFDELCRKTCELFGVFSIARIDFRTPDCRHISSAIDVSDCRFLEINVLPSITTSGSWNEHIGRHLEENAFTKADVHRRAIRESCRIPIRNETV